MKGLDDRRMAHGVLEHAQRLMADAVHAEHAFFSTCGSSLSVKSAMPAVAGPHEKLLVARNAHKYWQRAWRRLLPHQADAAQRAYSTFSYETLRPAEDGARFFAVTNAIGNGRGFAVQEAMDQVGALIGPLAVAGMLAAAGGDYAPSLGMLAVPGVAALGCRPVPGSTEPQRSGRDGPHTPPDTPIAPAPGASCPLRLTAIDAAWPISPESPEISPPMDASGALRTGAGSMAGRTRARSWRRWRAIPPSPAVRARR
ncbi:hypothetical protein FHS39_004949 [Streptomyces olivoverticillatus]|uniref:Orn/Lys/Arg decarboxylases family 1 pyridoxal-P attachment site domain-containing protein n=1 Tax=Streptomyces olivoverticillatus TaxID=66427 RepID=A0A7W7LSY2_9ACTN|nr:hypothetical protein [Streptomyces olivoverticillatus]